MFNTPDMARQGEILDADLATHMAFQHPLMGRFQRFNA
jgi:hypothetical protein